MMTSPWSSFGVWNRDDEKRRLYYSQHRDWRINVRLSYVDISERIWTLDIKKKNDETNSKVMRVAECDLWIHTNGPCCRSLPGEKTQTLTVVGSAVQFTLLAVFYLHRGIHKGNWALWQITSQLLGTLVSQSTSQRAVWVCLCMREINRRQKDKGNIVIKCTQ